MVVVVVVVVVVGCGCCCCCCCYLFFLFVFLVAVAALVPFSSETSSCFLAILRIVFLCVSIVFFGFKYRHVPCVLKKGIVKC